MESSYGVIQHRRIFKLQKLAVGAMRSATARELGRPIFTKLGIMTLPAICIYHCLVSARDSSFRKNGYFHTYGTTRDLLSIPFHRQKTTTAFLSIKIIQ